MVTMGGLVISLLVVDQITDLYYFFVVGPTSTNQGISVSKFVCSSLRAE